MLASRPFVGRLAPRVARRLPCPLRPAAERLAARERVVRARVGARPFYYPSRSDVGRHVAEGRGWDAVLRPMLRALVRTPAPLVIEVGSNIGASLLQIKAALPDARVVCFEPSPRFRPILRRNLRANGWSREVTIESTLVGSREGEELDLHSSDSSGSAVARDYAQYRSVRSDRVRTTTLDASFGTRDDVAFLKVDTDGYEGEVLAGARELLARARPVLFLEYHRGLIAESGSDPGELLERLAAAGYRDVLVLSNFGEALGVEHDVAGVLRRALAAPDYVDLVAVHRGDRAGVAALEPLAQEIGSRYVLDVGDAQRAAASSASSSSLGARPASRR